MEKFGISGPEDLASFEDAACDAVLEQIREHAPGELYDWKPESQEADPWSE